MERPTHSVAADTQRHTAAEHLRRLIPLVAFGDLDPDMLEDTVTALRELADRLEPGRRDSRYPTGTGIELGSAHPASNEAIWKSHCVFGGSNAMAPPLMFESVEQVVTASATYGPAYEGQSGQVHGGVLAAAFDVVLGRAAAAAGQYVVTGTISIRFERSVPIGARAEFRAELTSIDGRKIRTAATVSCNGRICALADAVFITVGGERYGALPGTAEHAVHR